MKCGDFTFLHMSAPCSVSCELDDGHEGPHQEFFPELDFRDKPTGKNITISWEDEDA